MNFSLCYERLKLIKSPTFGLSLSEMQPIQTPPFTALFESLADAPRIRKSDIGFALTVILQAVNPPHLPRAPHISSASAKNPGGGSGGGGGAGGGSGYAATSGSGGSGVAAVDEFRRSLSANSADLRLQARHRPSLFNVVRIPIIRYYNKYNKYNKKN